MSDAAHLALAIAHGVIGLALAQLVDGNAARLAEVNVAGQLAHNHDVQAGHHFRLQRGGIGQLRVQNGRPQIGEQVQILADGQQAAFRSQRTLQLVIGRAAHRAQQHRVGFAAQFLGEFRIGLAKRVVAGAAQGACSVSMGRPSLRSTSSTRCAWATISGPMPSPGRMAIFILFSFSVLITAPGQPLHQRPLAAFEYDISRHRGIAGRQQFQQLAQRAVHRRLPAGVQPQLEIQLQ